MPSKKGSRTFIKTRNKLPTREELIELYWNQNKTANEIGILVGVSGTTILKWMESLGIKRRHAGPHGLLSVKRSKLRSKVTKKELSNLYVKQRKTVREIGRMFGVSDSAVCALMKIYGIKGRGPSEARKGIPQPHRRKLINVSTAELKRLYCEKRLTTIQISKIFDVSSTCVGDTLKRRGIPLRYPHHGYSRRKKTNIEIRVENEIKNNKLPFVYTGDGTFWVGNLNPDFVSINESKVVIDVLGNYWHDQDSLKEREAVFEKFGFRYIPLWEEEILNGRFKEKLEDLK